MTIKLQKKIEENATPEFVSLVKKVDVGILNKGLSDHVAQVGMVLDISLSMQDLYTCGIVQALAERVLALSTQFDNDGSIELFTFGVNAHKESEPMSLENYKTYVQVEVLGKRALEHGTKYAKAMNSVTNHYFTGFMGAKKKVTTPVYILFLTDGDAGDKSQTKDKVIKSSKLPIFWQFIGIGDAKFTFLKGLDDLKGRDVDNTGFFSFPDFNEVADEVLIEAMLKDYSVWLKEAKAKGVLK